ncbi:MAG TPA: capsular polysaccharide synthesis protein [Cellvibrionaceae bacterium]|nr:capsular polysaccharide synthesis protein [Cellvibrionaceae bacterium]
MKFRLKHRLRIHFSFLRQKTPPIKDQVKKIIWGEADKTSEAGTIPKIIWLYWHEETISSNTAELCINLIKRLHPSFNVQVLNNTTVLRYLPEFPRDLMQQQPNFVSDLVRLMLIEHYGGIYLDATVLLSKPIDWALRLYESDHSEAVLYYTDENTLEQEFPMVESWFIAAKPNSNFIRAWREEYQNNLESSDLTSRLQECDLVRQAKFPLKIPYYLVYLAAQIVMRKDQNYRLSLLRAEDDAFFYGLGFKKKWDEVAMADLLLFNPKSTPSPNLIKLIRYDRIRLDYYIQRKFYKKDSWLGELLTD